MDNIKNIAKYVTSEVENAYDSSYDYAIYDIKFIFNDEEEINDQEDSLNENYLNLDIPNIGGNIH
ncbi:hypothetical protein GF322_01430 [Candidatus Dependentiae bacterium]|nr:hypothetical protein [Candidatus Dependentiae bacterium]